MIAYMINDYYICVSYEEVTSLMYDIVHHSLLTSHMDSYDFRISKGILDIEKKEFTSEKGKVVMLQCEPFEDIYYKVH